MANPQKENGHTALANELWDALARYRLSGEEWKVFVVIIRKTYGWQKKADIIPRSQFAELTGMTKRSVDRALHSLSAKSLIGVRKIADRQALEYSIIKDFEKWEPVRKKADIRKIADTPVRKKASSPVREIAALKRNTKESLKERYTPSENAKILNRLFLGTMSDEFQEKHGGNLAWMECFDRLLKEFDVDRLKVMILYYRRDDFWKKNFLSPLKLRNKNKDGIRYVDYFLERMKSGAPTDPSKNVQDYSTWDSINHPEGA